MYSKKYLPIREEKKFTVGCSYYNLPVNSYPNLISCIYQHVNHVYLIEEIEGGFKVLEEIDDNTYNDILLKEYRKLPLMSNLVLTGSLALHVYKPLNRKVSNINTLCDIFTFRQIQELIVPRDYYCMNDEDPRSWGVMHNYNIEVLVKNKLSYLHIDDIKIANLDDIISAQLYLSVNTNIMYLKNIKEYISMCNHINLNNFG